MIQALAKAYDHDRGFRKEMRRLLKSNAEWAVGVVGPRASSQHPGSTVTYAELAAIHEFGLGVPQRPFMRNAFDGQEEKLGAEIAQDVTAATNIAEAVTDTLQAFASDAKTALKRGALSLPGSGTPLVETGALAEAITVVRR